MFPSQGLITYYVLCGKGKELGYGSLKIKSVSMSTHKIWIVFGFDLLKYIVEMIVLQ